MRTFIRVCSFFLFISLSTSYSHTADLFGGKIHPIDEIPAPYSHKPNWSGFYLGGGIGLQKLNADVNIDSKNHSEAADYHYCKDKDGKHAKYKGSLKDENKHINYGDNTKEKFDFAKNCLENHQYRVLQHDSLKHYSSDFDFSHSEEISSDWNAFGTVMIGYDHQVSKRVVIGAFASFDFGSNDLQFSHTETGIPVGEYWESASKVFDTNDAFVQHVSVSGDLEQDYTFTLGGRVGYLTQDQKTLGYFLAGYSRTSIDGTLRLNVDGTAGDYNSVRSYDYVPINLKKNISEDLNGFTIGAGAEHRLSKRWSARIEYRYTWFNNIEEKFSALAFSNDSIIRKGNDKYHTWTRSTSTDTEIDIDPSLHSVRAVLSYRFGASDLPLPPLK